MSTTEEKQQIPGNSGTPHTNEAKSYMLWDEHADDLNWTRKSLFDDKTAQDKGRTLQIFEKNYTCDVDLCAALQELAKSIELTLCIASLENHEIYVDIQCLPALVRVAWQLKY